MNIEYLRSACSGAFQKTIIKRRSKATSINSQYSIVNVHYGFPLPCSHHLWIECIAQTITEQIEAQNRPCNG